MGRQYTLRAVVNDCRIEPRRLAAVIVRTVCVALAWAALAPGLELRLRAHEIPNDVTVHAFLRPEGQRLRLLVRAPLAAMRDILFPTRDQVHLDFARADAAVRDAATLWIADSITIYEGGTPPGGAAAGRDAECRCRPIDRLRPTTRRSRTSPDRRSRPTRRSCGTRR